MEWYVGPPVEGVVLSAEGLLGFARHDRHALLNDLQVLGGWLQLGKTEAAIEYLTRLQSRLTRDPAWSLVDSPDLEAALLVARLTALGRGLELSVGVRGPDPASTAAVAAARDRGDWSHHGRFRETGRGDRQAALRSAAGVFFRVLLRIIADVAESGETAVSSLRAELVVYADRVELRVGAVGMERSGLLDLVKTARAVVGELGLSSVGERAGPSDVAAGVPWGSTLIGVGSGSEGALGREMSPAGAGTPGSGNGLLLVAVTGRP